MTTATTTTLAGPKFVEVPTIKTPIRKAPGFAKKGLADFKLDLVGLCQFGCVYCSSNCGNYLRIRQQEFLALTEEQTGNATLPVDDPSLMFVWEDILERLDEQLSDESQSWGRGETLVFSMLTDGFSPHLVGAGITEAALRMVLERTSFRIRVLTKNSIVGTRRWIKFFDRYPGRFVVGLSIGTLDDDWAKRIERLTPSPSSRIAALRNLQDAGIPTFGMLCPVFPHVLESGMLDQLLDQIRPEQTETVWAEPFNDRKCWRKVREVLEPDSFDANWLTEVYENRRRDLWSRYATNLYERLRKRAVRDGWFSKLVYLLYELDIEEHDAEAFRGLEGVLLQATPAKDGLSQNPTFVELQTV